jgi:hypothetical protein
MPMMNEESSAIENIRVLAKDAVLARQVALLE